MENKLNKLLDNPILYIQIFFKFFYIVWSFPYRFLFFQKTGFFTYVSFTSSVRNSMRISLENHVQINSYVVLWPTKLSIGAYSQINPGTAVYGKVTIGANVMIAPNCVIAGGNHKFDRTDIPMLLQGHREMGIFIGDDVWIGANSTIVDGVTIGKGSVIGAHSLVTKDIPDYSVAYGSPAVVIKKR